MMRVRLKTGFSGIWFAAALLGAAISGPLAPAAGAQAASTGLETVGVFAKPQARQALANGEGLLRAGRNQQAIQVLDPLLARYPGVAVAHYLKAVAQARLGNGEGAIASLEAAVDAGYGVLPPLQSEQAFGPLRDMPRFAKVLEKAQQNAAEPADALGKVQVEPAIVRGGKALVSDGNTELDSRTNLLLSRFTFNSKLFADPNAYKGQEAEAAKLLNDLVRRGFAAGNTGDLYDNRDRGHSVLSTGWHPQLSHTEYTQDAKQAGVDFSFNSSIVFDAPTIGNASLGVGGAVSLARVAMDQPRSIGILYLQYRSNQLYIYPGVSDHLAGGVDAFPAKTPYLLVSQGRSSSDRPLLSAAAVIMAAFKPKVKDYLIEQKLLMPTLQMVFRNGQKTVREEADYLTAVAHPTVFEPENLDLVRMIRLANAIEIEDVPPAVQLSVIEESSNKRPAPTQKVNQLRGAEFTTPGAIARAVVREDGQKRLVVSAAGTRSPNGQKPSFDWVVLEGDAERVRITPRNVGGSAVEIVVDWHGRRASAATPGMKLDRVDIGVFAKSGRFYSAPAFISVYNTPADVTHPSLTKPAQN